ncbi:unnamed protein product [Paramecium sonneborni]|uniref:Uncharacterized protein n=1 Tax=Paramecium sonneborni TaxID=65129 RepID=A0A8S1R765_9CILI|nr:unnamed protein product [Paramecium sonneborni]
MFFGILILRNASILNVQKLQHLYKINQYNEFLMLLQQNKVKFVTHWIDIQIIQQNNMCAYGCNESLQPNLEFQPKNQNQCLEEEQNMFVFQGLISFIFTVQLSYSGSYQFAQFATYFGIEIDKILLQVKQSSEVGPTQVQHNIISDISNIKDLMG